MHNIYLFFPFLTTILLILYQTSNRVKLVSCLTILLCISSTCLFAQTVTPIDTIKPGNGPRKEQLKEIKAVKAKTLIDSTDNQPKKSPLIDTTIQNKYGDLLNDDITLNKKYPVWKPALQVFGINVFTQMLDRALKQDFSHVGPSTWKYNIQTGWEWDSDRFGINFIGHPYTGSMYFNAARSQGYNYAQSIPFAVGGSLIWEYFGENTRPSYNDLINTPINGAFLGEIFYRLSSNILDDRTTGSDRLFREIAAGLVDPVRGLNRLLQGKSFRRTTKEVYQKEPLNITIFAGLHKINQDNKAVFGKGPTEALINMQFDYGNPFEERYRKPFDFFRLRTEFSFGSGRKLLDNLTGYGILLGDNTGFKTRYGKFSILYGLFQYDDYWDNKTFELGAIGVGGGVFTKYPITKVISLYTNFHLALVPLAGNSTRFGPDTSQVRDYTYNNGIETKFETTLNVDKALSLSFVYYYFFMHTYFGTPGNNNVSILKPRVTINVTKNLSLGFEHFIYYDDRYLKNLPGIYSVRTEQKVFVSLFLEDQQRKGRYN
jgi:hypothetical protein